jgi:hypothetical protein
MEKAGSIGHKINNLERQIYPRRGIDLQPAATKPFNNQAKHFTSTRMGPQKRSSIRIGGKIPYSGHLLPTAFGKETHELRKVRV